MEVLNTVGTADMYMEMLHSSNFPGTNPFGWRDPRTDQLIDTFLTLIEKWRKINAEEVKGDKQRLIAALNREIYSKVQW